MKDLKRNFVVEIFPVPKIIFKADCLGVVIV